MRLAKNDGVLFRSRIEIVRILNELARAGDIVSADFGDAERLFLTSVLGVAADGESFVIAFGAGKESNNALLAAKSVRFRANTGLWRVEFAARAPVETPFDGRAAVRLSIPQTLLRSQRRKHPRVRLPEDASLRCVADCAGVASFEARIVDISRGGFGGMIHDPGIKLSPGTVLRGCRIVIPGADAVVADLEVRYSVPATLPDGSIVERTGVKFRGEPRGLRALLEKFVIEFGAGRTEPA